MKDREIIKRFISDRILQSKQRRPVHIRDLKNWIKEECQIRHYDEEIVNEIISEAIQKKEISCTQVKHSGDSPRRLPRE